RGDPGVIATESRFPRARHAHLQGPVTPGHRPPRPGPRPPGPGLPGSPGPGLPGHPVRVECARGPDRACRVRNRPGPARTDAPPTVTARFPAGENAPNRSTDIPPGAVARGVI